jgi:uncharacterized protein YbjT (DUF2867 family)
MRIVLTGYSSGIGKMVTAIAEREGHEIVRMGRNPKTADLPFSIPDGGNLSAVKRIGGVIHLAWDWNSNDANVSAGRILASQSRTLGVQPVLLSTISTLSSSSEYGQAKARVEEAFIESGGSALRAGIVWGPGASGIIQTLRKLSNLPLLLPQIFPNRIMHHSEISELARALVRSATVGASHPIELAIGPDGVYLNALLAALREEDKAKILLPIPIGLAARGARWMENMGIHLPFRADSLSALEGAKAESMTEKPTPNVGGMASGTDFLGWAKGLAGGPCDR